MYLGSDAASEPWPGAEGFLRVLLEVLFDRDDTLFEKSFGFSLAVILPEEKTNNISTLNQATSPLKSTESFQHTNRRCMDS